MNDEVQSIINEVCNKRIGIGQTDNDKWWLHQMWIAQHKIADYLMKNDLQERIIKAIDYIESECNEFYVNEPHYRGYQIINIEPLLDILKGSDNDER